MGIREGKNRAQTVCLCVLRKVFRGVFNRYRKVQSEEHYLSQIRLTNHGRGSRHRTWGHRNREFAADFILLSRRTLSPDSLEWRVFVLHFLRGLKCGEVCRRLWINRGVFFHSVYRVEQHLGRAFATTQPYGLWPLDEYFGGTVRGRRKGDLTVTLSC